MTPLRASVLLCTASCLLGSAALAQSPERPASSIQDPLPGRTAIRLAALERPTGIAEFGFGWLTLPGASVCVARDNACPQGDTSFEIDAWQLYRGTRRWAFGAGLLLALIPTTDVPLPETSPREPTIPPPAAAGDAKREHSRQYFTVEGTARYYPYVGQNVEWWIGVTGGLVVVSDRFVVQDDSDRALLGPQGVTIRTEGGSVGLAGGPVIALTQNWTLGATLRWGQWILPRKAAKDPLGSEASLTGRNTVLSLGANVAFRLGL